MASPKAMRGPFYRLEQTGRDTFALQGIVNEVVQSTDIKNIFPVNVLGGSDITGFGYLYSKVVYRQAGVNQEVYALQTVLQWDTNLNA